MVINFEKLAIMKKLFVSLSAMLFVFSALAQDSLLLFKRDGSVVSYALADVDSIKFSKKVDIHVTSISLNRTAIGLLQGDAFALQASVEYEGETLPVVVWTSSNNSVASVDADGKVSALTAGSATITATVGGKQTTCAITVIANGESVYRHGYSELNDADKAIYNYMLKQILAFENNATTYSDIYHRVYLDFYSQGMTVDQNKVMKLTNLIIKDVPETYVLVNYIYRYDYDTYQYYLRVKSSCTPENYASEMAQINAACDSITKQITPSSTEFEKTKIIHDGFIAWADYGGVSNANSGDITGSFITRKAVCEGFSRAHLLLSQRVGLKCVYITGSMMTSPDPETWGNHAWNLSEVDGVWYLMDITGDGGFTGMCGYRSFLLGTDTFSASYSYEGTGGVNENVGDNAYTTLPAVSTSDYEWAERP